MENKFKRNLPISRLDMIIFVGFCGESLAKEILGRHGYEEQEDGTWVKGEEDA